MKNLKYGMIGIGVLGLLAVFVIPLASFGKHSITLWDARKGAAIAVYLPLLAFLVTGAMGGMAAAKGKMEKWMGGAAAGLCTLALIIMVVKKVHKFPAFGAKLLLILALAGAIVGGLAAAKGDE